MPIRKWFSLCTFTLLILAMPASSAWSQQYTVTDLGTFPGGGVSQGQAVNVIGQVVGYARFANYNAHGFIWTEKTGLVDLGSFPPASNFSVAQGINSLGEVVGYSDHADALNQRAVLWSNGKFRDLGTLPGGTSSLANAINDLGEITGYSNGAPGVHAVTWDKQGGIRDLNALSGGYSQGIAINLQGEVAGYSITEDGKSHGVLWSKPSGILALPYLSASDTMASANGINNLGQIAGGSGNTAVLWQNDNGHTVQSLGTLPGQTWSSAFAINDLTQAVGWSGFIAFVWSPAQGMQNLNDLIPSNSGWSLTLPTGISSRGQITGQGTINGQQHGFLLTPVAK
jgi:probable HAF family extracellular repeat protein